MTAAGGKGIAVRCDHGDDGQVAALFQLVEQEQGRLDILVNNAAEIYEQLTTPGRFWEKPLKFADLMHLRGSRGAVRSGYSLSRAQTGRWSEARAARAL